MDPEKCGGCGICELVCSLAKNGECNPAKSRVHVTRREWTGLYFSTVCQQCDPPFCRITCPIEGALIREEKTGTMFVDDEECTRCTLCVKACPFGAIHYNPEEKTILICDECKGEPKCVKWCPRGALRYVTVEEYDTFTRREAMDKLLNVIKASQYARSGR